MIKLLKIKSFNQGKSEQYFELDNYDYLIKFTAEDNRVL